MYKGKLKSWNDKKGFGFIQSDELEQDTFIHISTLKAMSRKPKRGDVIFFDVEKQDNGKTKAVNCSIEGVEVKPQKVTSNETQKASEPKGEKSNGKILIAVAIVVIVVGIFFY